MSRNDNHTKVLFNFYSDLLDEQTVETMWVEVVDVDNGIYMLDSIPFYALNIACGDTIIAHYDPEMEQLVYKETIAFSGNSTVQVVLMDKSIVTNDVREIFHGLGCETEKFNDSYFVIDVPVESSFKLVEAKLNELSDLEMIGYAVPCLSAEHRDTQ